MSAAADLERYRDLFAKKAFAHLATVGGDVHQKYTATFSGTSSAAPLVAATPRR